MWNQWRGEGTGDPGSGASPSLCVPEALKVTGELQLGNEVPDEYSVMPLRMYRNIARVPNPNHRKQVVNGGVCYVVPAWPQ